MAQVLKDDLTRLKGKFPGPSGSVYEGGTFEGRLWLARPTLQRAHSSVDGHSRHRSTGQLPFRPTQGRSARCSSLFGAHATGAVT